MVPEIIIACALALPPATVHFKGWDDVPTKQFIAEYKEIKAFLNGSFPGGEFYVMPKRLHAVPAGYVPLPFSWRGHKIYERAA